MITLNKRFKVALLVTVVVLVVGAGMVYGLRYQQQQEAIEPYANACYSEKYAYLRLIVHEGVSDQAVYQAAKKVGGEASKDWYSKPEFHILVPRSKRDKVIAYFKDQSMTKSITPSVPTCTQ